MTRMHPILAAAILLLLAASPALAKSYNLRTLEVADPWTRPAPAGGTAVGYMVLTNHGKTPLSLLSAHTALAKTVSLHQTRVAAGVASMAVVPRGIVIPPGQTVAVAPGGYHLMLEGVAKALNPGDSAPLVLVFSGGQKLRVELEVRSGAAPAGGMANMAGMHH